MCSNDSSLQEIALISDLVFSVFAFHFLASIVWFAVCGFGAISVVTRRVRNRLQTAFPVPIVNAAS
jgi:amino acid transporter